MISLIFATIMGFSQNWIHAASVPAPILQAENVLAIPSDLRWKTNVRPIENSLEKVMKMRGVTYEWRNDRHKNFPSGTYVGLIAQEVEQVVPYVVVSDRDGYKSVEYARLVGVLIEAIKTQQQEINALKADIKTLKLTNSKTQKLKTAPKK